MREVAEPRAAEVVLDALEPEAAREALARCCGSKRWVAAMLARRPFASEQGLLSAARACFSYLEGADFLEAFSAHPAIGADPAALRAKFGATAAWSSEEQAGVAAADERVMAELAVQNRAYLERFGCVFIICASGKSAAEMLLALNARLCNEPERELEIAAREQEKITMLRLEKLAR